MTGTLIYDSRFANRKYRVYIPPMSASRNMRPQDLVVLLKIVAMGPCAWRGIDLASQLSLSPSEVSGALKRMRNCGLLDNTKRRVAASSLHEFLVHGLPFVFPAQMGAAARGVPTAHSSAPMDKLVQGDGVVVWASSEGSLRGDSLEPLYPSAPAACLLDPALHELLALTDCLRMGRTRERSLADRELKARLDSYALQQP
jgi:hypothetical protein